MRLRFAVGATASFFSVPEQSLPQGLSTLNWNGMTTLGTKVPAGTYLVRVTARSAEGTQAQGLTTLSLKR
jgi:flagellar hook assembly protein FlgD